MFKKADIIGWVFAILLLVIVSFAGCSNGAGILLYSDEKSISSFNFSSASNNGNLVCDVTGDINDSTINLFVPCQLTSLVLKPEIVFSGVSITPDNEVAQDFSAPVIYTVIAENESIRKYTVTISNDSYYAFYKFNDFTDSSVNGHTLWNYGVTPAQNRMGTANAAYNFSIACLDAWTPEEFAFTTELTISAWIRSTDVAADQKIAGKVNGGRTLGYLMGIQNSRLKIETWDSTNTWISFNDGSQLLSNNSWHHVAITWETGGYLRSYVDGALDKEVAATSRPLGNVTDRYFTIGAAPWDRASFKFQGEIDDVRIYGKELKDFEIEYLAGLPAD